MDDLDGLAVALFARGLYARFLGVMPQAEADFCACLRLQVPHLQTGPAALARQLFLLVVQAELARTRREYPQAQRSTKTALALARACGDRYTFSTLLIGQRMFACRNGWFDEVRRLFPACISQPCAGESSVCWNGTWRCNRHHSSQSL